MRCCKNHMLYICTSDGKCYGGVIFDLLWRRGVETGTEAVWSVHVSEASFRNGSREDWCLSQGINSSAIQLEKTLDSLIVHLHGASKDHRRHGCEFPGFFFFKSRSV